MNAERSLRPRPIPKRPRRAALVHAILIVRDVNITVELPDDVAQRPNPGREALEALAIEGYRSGILTHYQASQLLQVSRLEFDALLKSRHIEDHAYDVADLEQDLETLERLEASGRLPRP